MKVAQFKRLLAQVPALTGAQLLGLQKVVASAEVERTSLAVIEAAHTPACRHCGSLSIVRNGTRNGLQRYRCHDCGKTSNAATGTPLSRLRHKARFEAYARCMREGLSVRKAAASCGVCVDTAHRWRLRFLANVQAHQPKAVTGMLEVDETYFQIGGVPLDGCIDKPDMTTQKSRAQFGDQLFKGIGLSAEALAKLPRQSALSA